MEKVKYIVKGLGAVLAGVGLMLALGYGLVAIGKLLGLEAEHVTGGVVVLITRRTEEILHADECAPSQQLSQQHHTVILERQFYHATRINTPFTRAYVHKHTRKLI